MIYICIKRIIDNTGSLSNVVVTHSTKVHNEMNITRLTKFCFRKFSDQRGCYIIYRGSYREDLQNDSKTKKIEDHGPRIKNFVSPNHENRQVSTYTFKERVLTPERVFEESKFANG